MTGGEEGGREIMDVEPDNIRVIAAKRTWDGKALLIRLHQAAGMPARCRLQVTPDKQAGSCTVPTREPTPRSARLHKLDGCSGGLSIFLKFKPYEIKTIRIEPSGLRREVALADRRMPGIEGISE